MSEPVCRFTMEGDAEYGVFLEPPHLRWWCEEPGCIQGWHSARSGDLLMACVATQFAHEVAASRERVAALEKLLREARCALVGEDSADYAWSGAQGADFDSLTTDINAALGEEAKDGDDARSTA